MLPDYPTATAVSKYEYAHNDVKFCGGGTVKTSQSFHTSYLTKTRKQSSVSGTMDYHDAEHDFAKTEFSHEHQGHEAVFEESRCLLDWIPNGDNAQYV